MRQRRLELSALAPGLGVQAALYLAVVLALGALALAWAIATPLPASDWPAFIALLVVLLGSQALPVAGFSGSSSRPALAVVVAGVAILPPPLQAALALVAATFTGLRCQRPAYARVFEGASLLVAARGAAVSYDLARAQLPVAESELLMALGLLAASLTLLALLHLLPRLLDELKAAGHLLPRPLYHQDLLADLGLCCAGATFAVLWQGGPLLAFLALLPIVPISRGLGVAALEHAASTDPKTMLLNFRAFEHKAIKEFERAKRSRRELALLVADLDLLREVNNRHGHLAGDVVLRHVAERIRDCLADSSLGARFGGEEFCILVPDAGAREGLELAERIRAQVAKAPINLPSGEAIHVTLSLGVAAYPRNGRDLRGVLGEADAAMYRAKAAGRNRCSLAPFDKRPPAAQHQPESTRWGAFSGHAAFRRSFGTKGRGEKDSSRASLGLYAFLLALAGVAAATPALLGASVASPWNGFLMVAVVALPSVAVLHLWQGRPQSPARDDADLARANRHLRSTYENTLLALVAALDAREQEMPGHSERVANYAVAIGEAMGLEGETLAHLRLGALLHDIGKIGLPDSVLRKNGPLSAGEWQMVRNHAYAGYAILQGSEFLGIPGQVVLAHHERYDGSGYPLGLKGDEIPLPARIFAMADALDAITSQRPYRAPQSLVAALEEIERCAGSQFDPGVVKAFLKAFAGEISATRAK